ncbi:uncharacterized protein IL334_002100 [Kwoniella shivajii]|uniref:SEC7 domain-containing protein n=1 Tax=Kwoniella shivajii TaxID=564305 RepID=A0ABZ1CXX2_9TREE|nr:hypothetical protein IL334_002100 [Kwoniella shivajii]
MKPPSISSPIPRSSPNLNSNSTLNARAPSPNLIHRPSTSSNRSKRSEADFEAALLDPKSTIFLSAGPSNSYNEEDASTATSKLTLGPSISMKDKGKGQYFDHETDSDTPLPNEKRSFEEDLINLKKQNTTATTTTTPAIDGRKGLGILMESPRSKIQNNGIGVIPPTPSTVRRQHGHNRNSSQMTTDSYNSMNSDTPSTTRRRASKSLGIDAELGEKPIPKNIVATKRRSIFRSPGTASSPDLATLVRKAKEAKSTQSEDPVNDPPPSSGNPTTSSTATTSTAKTTTTPHRNGAASNRPGTSGSTRYAPSPSPSLGESSTATMRNRERSITNPKSDEQWERYGNMLGGNQMASIAEGSRTTGGRNRTQSSDEGFKSMRNKARGVFGKMFGSTKDYSLPSTTPPSATSSRFPEHSSPRPPVPPVPSAYAAQRRKPPSPPTESSDIFTVRNPPPQSSRSAASSVPPPRQSSPAYDGRASVTPTGTRQVSSNSVLSVDKPLPAVIEPEDAPVREPSLTLRTSGHSRQPASAAHEESPPFSETPLKPSASPATRAVHTFKSDMAGILANIGHSEPARELGLPPDSVRRDRDRSLSAETTCESLKVLGKSTSKDRATSHLSPVPTQRTTSLPVKSPQVGRAPSIRQISPNPSLNGDTSLMPVNTASRSSSRSSEKRSPSHSHASSPARSPSLSRNKKSFEESPLIPSSVRLISSPRPDSAHSAILPVNITSEALAKASFINTSPWGKQPPRMPSGLPDENRDDQVETVNTPPETPKTTHEEDEEERGRRLACEFLEDDFTSVPKDKVAEFLGGPRPINAVALKYYMQYFDMKAQTLVDSFRDLCQKLHLKAESQEIDRIIEAFSARYFDCNPTTVFGTPGVVHTVTAAMLMLNTDLHIAELNKHMSRTDFVRNAMRAIHESMPTDERSSTPDLVRDDGSSMKLGFGSTASMAPSVVSLRSKTPMNPLPAQRSASAPVIAHAAPTRTDSVSSIGTNGLENKTRGSSTTVSSFNYSKAWESEAEAALRDIFASVKSDRILLPISGHQESSNRQSMMSVSSNGPFDRSRTVRSPSDRVNVLKRGSIRGMQGLMNNPYGSQWSASDGRLSPTPSYATSINEGLGSFAATLGFASNLSHTVIREHDDEVRSIDSQTSTDTAEDMDDDELALLGAPWAKEGLLSRKLYWESVGKRAKKNDWKQFFVVISKGELYMFTFGEKGGGGFMGGSVGGGNWLENANAIGQIALMHTMTVALPKPGYNSSRPYCLSLAGPSGETSFFQAGTEDLVGEWVSTCNYWAARRSRQPLQGGVSNMEYGWNRALDHSPIINNSNNDEDDRASVKSGRSNLSKLGSSVGVSSYGRRTIGSSMSTSGTGMNDRIHINEWKPPPPATMPSPLDEESQLEALQNYVRSLVDELEQHKSIEEPMTKLYTPGSKNLTKARDNWKSKSHYIHTEIFKYETYVEALRNAISLRVKKQGEKKLEKSLARSMTSLHRADDNDSDNVEEDGEEKEI